MREKTGKKRAICRDFLRNHCARGERCKYQHPEEVVFCHDFQSGKCMRATCAFVHCSKEEAEHYDETSNLLEAAPAPPLVRETPVCKDFINGECDRVVCKFRHPPPTCSASPPFLSEPLIKRRRYDSDQIFSTGQVWNLEDENVYLRRVVGELKKRVDDLQTTNEFLLEQNAQMRLSDKGQSLTAVTVPAAVTITTNGQIQPQVSTSIRTVTASVATVPVSIATVAGTPVSIATVSMSPVMPAPSVSIASPHPGSSDTAQTLLSAAAGQLVSYPLVARPVITNLTH